MNDRAVVGEDDGCREEIQGVGDGGGWTRLKDGVVREADGWVGENQFGVVPTGCAGDVAKGPGAIGDGCVNEYGRGAEGWVC
ncbi:MAG: hypothetical protein HZA91_06980 [Verrucomicrobia bacterium]|nr:hypothetical protein [Verrucomicrobiota bacterium]